MGGYQGAPLFTNEFFMPKTGYTALDIGCGRADILGYMQDINYWGFDISEPYIKRAKDYFGDRGQFR